MATREPIGVMLLVSSLEYGGAERQVVELARHLDRRRFRPLVCSLSSFVPLAEGVLEAGRDLVIVEKRGRYDLSTVGRVARVMSERDIRLVHAFLFDAEMVARFAGPKAGVDVVVASERNADYRWPVKHWVLQRLTRGRFDVMIANSTAGKRFNMRTLGIPAEKIAVVHNGVDVERYRPLDREAARAALGLAGPHSGPYGGQHAETRGGPHSGPYGGQHAETHGGPHSGPYAGPHGGPNDPPVVGMVAMFKKQKRHEDFLHMARIVATRFPSARFLCVGEPLHDRREGSEGYHATIRRLVEELGLRESCLFPGTRDDMPEVYNACDVTVLTSSREGTPNVLLESMACGVPVVATDVADNAHIVPDGRVGFIVPLGDTAALADRVCRLLEDAPRRRALGEAARAWVQREFSSAALARKTEAVYEEQLRRKGVVDEGSGHRSVPGAKAEPGPGTAVAPSPGTGAGGASGAATGPASGATAESASGAAAGSAVGSVDERA
jgi:glycosyltransferase involved in cell wall biosynthesis